MAWVDLFIIVVIVLSALISLIRGFVKESISLFTWIIAGVLALRYYAPMAELFEPFISSLTLRQWVGGGCLFLVTLLVGAIVNFIVSQLVSKTGLSGTDRMLGTVFGLARGIMIVAVIVLLAGLTALPQDPWWQDSQFMPHFERVALWLADYLPADVAENIRFEQSLLPG